MAPKPVTDFWEDLHDQGSHVQGGVCLVSAADGDNNPLTNLMRSFRDDTLGGSGFGRLLTSAYYATLAKLGPVVARHLALRFIAGIQLLPFGVIALLWHFLTLPGIFGLVVLACLMRRRALRMRLAQASSVALVLLVASRAHAQSPYWEDQTHTQPTDDDASLDEIPDVTWHVGVRAGPYTPQLDAQLGVYNNGKGPYQAMFGNYAIMPMLDVDRVLWKRVGQLGVGLSAGYMGKSAHAWAAGTSPSDPDRMRSSGDTNKFRLIPLTATAVYRFTYLDDEYGIPLVPYARAGLAYYIWWISAPSGDFASVCQNGGQPPCTKNTAAGASLGVVGSIGLAIRAERIDSSAARSMRESGVAHAQEAAAKADAPRMLARATKGRTVEGITEYKLDNGLQVLLFPDPTQSTVTVNITYLVGSRLEGYGETGMAHLLEHMMFKGSPRHRNVLNLLQERGGQANGTTDIDRTNYFETLPASKENLDWALDLESDRMIHAEF